MNELYFLQCFSKATVLVLKLVSEPWTGNFDLFVVSVKVLMGACFSIRWSGSKVFLYSNITSESEIASYKWNEIEYNSSVLTLTAGLTSVAFPKVTLAQSGYRSKILVFNSFSVESYNEVGRRVFFHNIKTQ